MIISKAGYPMSIKEQPRELAILWVKLILNQPGALILMVNSVSPESILLLNGI